MTIETIITQLQENLGVAKMLSISPAVALPQREQARKEVQRIETVLAAMHNAIQDVNRMESLVALKHASPKAYEVVVRHINQMRAERNSFHADWYDREDMAEANDRRWYALGGTRN